MKKYIIATIALVVVVGAAGAVTSHAQVGGWVGNTGNGTGTNNTANFNNTKKVKVNQFNSAFQANGVTNNTNSGGNKANNNTGAVGGTSDPSIDTGSASAGVGITNTANHNAAAVANCGCAEDLFSSVGNTGNGADSTNKVTVNNTDKTKVNQSNFAVQVNTVTNNVNSGNNKANNNTGGDVNVNTGDAGSTTVISNTANSNEAVVGGFGLGL